MADDLFYACPVCGGPAAIVDGDSLRCPTCDDKRGSFGELYEHFQWGGPLASGNSGDAMLCELRHVLRDRFGSWDVGAMDRLRDWLIAEHGLTRERVMVAKLAAIVGLMRGEQSSSDVGDTAEWSRPMSKKELATLLGCPVSKKAGWGNQCAKDGTLRIRAWNRQSVRVDLACVPANLREKFRDPK